MLYVLSDGTIRLTRGDTARLIVTISNDSTNSTYVMNEDDILTLTIKKRVKDTESIIQKTNQGSNTFHFVPDDTQNLEFGRYLYDVQLATNTGDVYTIIGPSTFELLSEVTY